MRPAKEGIREFSGEMYHHHHGQQESEQHQRIDEELLIAYRQTQVDGTSYHAQSRPGTVL